MVSSSKIYFHPVSMVLCAVLSVFFACTAEEKIAEPFLDTDLPTSGTINLGPDAVDAYDVRVTTNQTDWEIIPSESVNWCSYEIIPNDGENAIIRFSIEENKAAEKREIEYQLSAPRCKVLKIKIVQLGTEYAVLFDLSTPHTVAQEGEEISLKVTSNATYTTELGYAGEDGPDEDSKDWIEISEQKIDTKAFSDKIFIVKVHENRLLEDRTGYIKFVSAEMTDPVVFTVIQERASAKGLSDAKVKVKNAELIEGNTYASSVVGKTIDGDYSTNYSSADLSSPEEGKGKSIVIEYTLEQSEIVDYVRLVQRSNDDKNSLFAAGGIKLMKADETDWNSIEEIPFTTTQTAGATVDIATKNAEAISKIRVRIERMTEGIDNKNVALAEFECYRYSESKNDISEALKFFTDETYSELKADVSAENLSEIKNAVIYQLAKGLLNKTYDKRFRVCAYHSCKDPTIVAKELTAGSRSKYDNPTGVFFKQGETMLVFVKYREASGNTPLTLSIDDFRDNGRHSVVSLKEGMNVITPANDGNGYIRYWTNDDTAAGDVDIHFCFGTQIGYWDVRRGDTDETWPEILEIAKKCAAEVPNAMMDILGEKVQLQNTVNAFDKCAPTAIKAVVDMFDRLLGFEYQLMGLEKYDAVPSNRFFGVRSWGSNPNWNGDRANYPNTEDAMLIPSKFYSGNNIWVFGHEFGHGNQIAQMNGNGWTEVTNNLYCAYAQYMMRNDELCEGYLRLEHEAHKSQPSSTTSPSLAGGRINAFLNEALVKNKQYFMQAASYTVSNGKPDVWNSDVFVRLVPLWQLAMYFMAAEVKPDFWPDVHWAAIHDNVSSYTPGQRYVNFMKRAIEASEMDLCGFFEGMGLLKVFDNVKVNDYTNATVNITQEMIDEVKALGSGKSLPDGGMKYISANSVDAFKNKAAVTGTFGSGTTLGTDLVTVDHEVWKNVVAFETYNGEDLTDISIVGTGDPKNKKTMVAYPAGSTRIEAVGYDGEKTLVYGTRSTTRGY